MGGKPLTHGKVCPDCHCPNKSQAHCKDRKSQLNLLQFCSLIRGKDQPVKYFVAPALFSKWTMILSNYFPNALKIHKFTLCNTLVMG